MAKRGKMARKGNPKGKKTDPSSSNRVIKTRYMDAVSVSLAQTFPNKISFIDEHDHEVELEVQYEWIPLGKQVWVPKKQPTFKEIETDADGFQKVVKGKQVKVEKEHGETDVHNRFQILDNENEQGIIYNMGEGGDPSTFNGSIPMFELGKFHVTFVYGFNDEKRREELWADLEGLAEKIKESCLVMGDFYKILFANERVGRKAHALPSQSFKDCVVQCSLEDLKYSGAFLTWNNKQKPDERIYSKIDRAMINPSWMNSFPSLEAVFLLEMSFDHRHILVSIYKNNNTGKKPFRYINIWKPNPQFESMVVDSWRIGVLGSRMYQVVVKLRRLKEVLKKLNREGIIHNKIFSIEDEAGNWRDSPEGVQKAFLDYYLGLLGTLPNRRQVHQSVMDIGPKLNDTHRGIIYTPYSVDEDCWQTVGVDIEEVVLSFLNSGKILKEINATTMTLIPKTVCPESMEYFSRIFKKIGDWPGFKFHDRCASLRLNHLCFVDDLLVFCNGDFISVMLMLKGLKLFSSTSGLVPNAQKTTVYCSGMLELEVNRILEASSFSRSTLRFRSFLWKGIQESAGSGLVAWERICQPKNAGGLGFRNIKNWNISAM
uniref:Reverse transcriptase domain-containing protein n=1 Tax=Cannabis sativa TaxID=3483 RepID=A0A803PUR3_CANSA